MRATPDYEKAARKAAQKYGIDPEVFVRQLRQESGLRPGLTSSAGAQGIAQFIPSTAKAYGVNLGDGRVSDDLDGAARYMRDNLDRTGEDYAAALSIYNSGRPDAYKDPDFAGGQTYNYVRNILGGAKPAKTPKVKAPRAPQTVTQTTRTPGVDNSGLRRQLIGDFLQHGGVQNSNAVLSLAGAYGQAADTPAITTTRKVRAPAKTSPSTGGSRSETAGSRVLELIFNDGGKGYGIKDGQEVDGRSVYSGVWDGHANHVHVAAGPKTVVRLGKLAQSMGLHVGENSHFGGENPASHVPGSYHNADKAIDVSGDPAKMAAFARRVRAYNRTRRLSR